MGTWIVRLFRSLLRQARILDRPFRVINPISWTWPASSRTITRISKLTPVERQAAAPNTFSEACTHALQFSNAIVDPAGPTIRKLGPIRTFRHSVVRQFCEFEPDLVECYSDLLSKNNKGDAANGRLGIAAMTGTVPLRVD